MNDPQIAVECATQDECFRQQAADLASELALPFLQDDNTEPSTYEFTLYVGEKGIELRDSAAGGERPLRVDFVTGSTAFRKRSAHQRNQLIARAIGLQRGTCTILDATAGLGRDAFLFACLGCTVTAVERSPILAALLRDGLLRAAESSVSDLKAIVGRISLCQGDARDILRGLSGDKRPDVVYIDPMYPPSHKSALAKKEMRMCRRLVGDDDDATELLAAARRVAGRRVVVKRHRHAAPLASDASVTYKGTTVRYDAYIRTGDD